MKDVSQYAVKYGFGLTSPTPPWSTSHPHLGVDRPTPKGTPLIINGILVAYTGNTGDVDAHHHLQKVQGGKVVDPKNEGFIIPSPATVYALDNVDDSNIGKALRIRDANGVEWSHFHLDSILVKVGDIISGMGKITKEMEDALSIMQTFYLPGANYDYRFTGQECNSDNVSAMITFWSQQARPPQEPSGYRKVLNASEDMYVKE